MFAHRLMASVAVIVVVGVATAQTGPQLATVFPNGVKSGESVEVTFTGSGFDGEEKLQFSTKGIKAEFVGASASGPGPGKQPGMKGQAVASALKFKITAPKDVAIGIHDVRVVSKSGLSNPRAFAVGELTEVNEVEPNNDLGQAQKIELNSVVNGVISTPTDVDYVVFKATAGQNIVVACATASIDSKLSPDLLVCGSDGRTITTSRGYRNGEAVLDFKAPSNGDYYVRVAEFAYTTGGPDHFYRLTVTTGPWIDAIFPPVANNPHTIYGRNLVGAKPDSFFTRPDGRAFDFLFKPQSDKLGHKAGLFTSGLVAPSAGGLDGRDDLEHPTGCLILNPQAGPCVLDVGDNTTSEKAQTVKVPSDIAGRIIRKNDRHWYSFEAKKGEIWTMEVFAERIGSPITPFVVVTDDKGKTIARIEEGPDSLSTNQFYTKSDDPARYRFVTPLDGVYKVMVSSIEAAFQSGVRDQYVLRIANEHPDFRLAVMPISSHLSDAGTLPRNGAVLFTVFVFRFDGFNDAITLTAANLPSGVSCPPQVIGVGQTRGNLVLTADADAKDWDGFITITGSSGSLKSEARPFTITWSQPAQNNQPPPNSPMLTRMDRGPGLALAIRGEAPFTLTPVEKELKGKIGDKLEVNLKVTRTEKFKDGIQVFSAVPNFGPRQQGNAPLQPLGTIGADKKEALILVDVPPNLPSGTYTLVLRGQSSAPVAKVPGNAARPIPTYPTIPITVVIEGRESRKK